MITVAICFDLLFRHIREYGPQIRLFLCVVTTALYVAAHTVHILFTFSFWFGFLIKYVYICQYIFAANFKLFKSYICKNARITECDSKSWSNITF